MKITFISTVLNEERNIIDFFDSLSSQTKLPDEIVIVDGASTDATASVISNFQFPISNEKSKNLRIKLIAKPSNRAVGRNEAIKNSTGDIIVCSDAGNILDKNWIENIIKPFEDSSVDVVAGYYKGLAKNVFQKCLIPYVLLMEDKVNPKDFFPSTRSIAFRRSIWTKARGFPEEFSHNEDYVFAKSLKKIGAKIIFQKSAIVYWLPRKNLKDSFIMFFRFAFGDAQARIFRPKVFLVIVRYLIGIILLVLFIISKSYFILNSLCFILVFYVLWSIFKNYKYVKDARAVVILPALQVISDIAVISGTSLGFIESF